MSDFHQARWKEPLIFELGGGERAGFLVPEIEPEVADTVGDVEELIPSNMLRADPPELPRVSEIEVLRHYIHLSQMTYGVTSGNIYPLGSCTMKYNPPINEVMARHPGITGIHPDQDEETVQGILEVMYKLKHWILELTGMDAGTLQPASGAHGEQVGILLMRAYHADRGELEKRTEVIVPDSAHGTNPANAVMGGFRTVEIISDEEGCTDVEALKSVVSESTVGLMLTNPNTLGIFERRIKELTDIVHEAGGLVYYDGANLNANLGKFRPGDMGFDITHVNLHKTFSTPHGGGGPGGGPVGVTESLADFLPVPTVERRDGRYYLEYGWPKTIGKIRGYYGNISPVLKAYTWVLSLGPEGLKEVSEVAVLNTNYIAHKLKEVRGLELPYTPEKPRKHECVFSAAPMMNDTGVRALDISKKLLDFGLHSPTNYFPLIVPEALMIEPTESEPIEQLDRFVEAMRTISDLAYEKPEEVTGAPTSTAVSRLDEVTASHPRTMCLSWRWYCMLMQESE